MLLDDALARRSSGRGLQPLAVELHPRRTLRRWAIGGSLPGSTPRSGDSTVSLLERRRSSPLAGDPRRVAAYSGDPIAISISTIDIHENKILVSTLTESPPVK
ncbi:hypothetical protein [Sorangium sp. So ce542]|uniref:hypothetical protein n=1 Tax=Sorangium sp. So ce542 TaxID=3133316 RepID=UPI003F6014BA